MKFVKYTSVGLIIGFGGYACYRLIVKQRLNYKVKNVADVRPLPSSAEPVEEQELTSTTAKNSTLLPRQDSEKNLSSSSNGSKVISYSFDSEQLPPKANLNEKLLKDEDFKQETSPVEHLNEDNNDEKIEENDDEPKVVTNSFTEKSDLIKILDTTVNSTVESDLPNLNDTSKKGTKEASILSTDSPSTTNCSLDVCPSTPCSSPLDISELDGETTTGSVDHYLTQRSFSMTSQSSIIGEGMVAKLEELLHQVEGLKDSVGEINADIATVRKIEPKLLTLSADSISLGDETNGDSIIVNGKDECSQTPSLEWDSNGISLLSDPDSNYSTIKEEDESLMSESLLEEKSELFSPISSVSFNSNGDTSLFISSLADITDQTSQTDRTEQDISSLQFSTSDANESFNDSMSIAQSIDNHSSLSVDK